MRKICISLSKGGVGKTTCCVSIAHGLSILGHKVLLIDTDDQGQDSYLLGIKTKFSLSNFLNGEVSLDEAIYKARENLYVLSGDRSLAGVKRFIGNKDFGAERTLKDALEPIENQFDYVLIDTSPSWDTLTINALFYCNEILIPVSLEALSFSSLVDFMKRITEIIKFNPSLKCSYLVPTFEDGRVKKSKEIMDILKKHYEDILCNPIRYCARLSESAAFGKTIFEYSPNSKAAEDFNKLITRITSK
jgi:chromosome partitioning protein